MNTPDKEIFSTRYLFDKLIFSGVEEIQMLVLITDLGTQIQEFLLIHLCLLKNTPLQ